MGMYKQYISIEIFCSKVWVYPVLKGETCAEKLFTHNAEYKSRILSCHYIYDKCGKDIILTEYTII